MRFRELFLFESSQEETNPFGWKHFVRFAGRGALLLILGIIAHGLIVVPQPGGILPAVNFSPFQGPVVGDCDIYPLDELSGETWVHRSDIRDSAGNRIGIIERSSYSRYYCTSGKIIIHSAGRKTRSLLPWFLSLGMEPALLTSVMATIVDPQLRSVITRELPERAFPLVDITTDGQRFMVARAIGGITERMAVLMIGHGVGLDLTAVWWGEYSGYEIGIMDSSFESCKWTGLRSATAFFDQLGRAVLVSELKIVSVGQDGLTRRELRMEPNHYILSAGYERNSRDRQYCVIQAQGTGTLCRIYVDDNDHPVAEELLCISAGVSKFTVRDGMAVLRAVSTRPGRRECDFYVDLDSMKILGVDTQPPPLKGGVEFVPRGWPYKNKSLRRDGVSYPFSEFEIPPASDSPFAVEWLR